jgi:Tol biopolymer transport system component
MTKKFSLVPILVFCLFLSACSNRGLGQKQDSPIKGKFAFYSLREGDSVKYWATYILEKGKIRKLPDKVANAIWSPDGTKLATATTKITKENFIRIYNQDNSLLKETKILYHQPVTLDWFPDGKKIVYVAGEKFSSVLSEIFYIVIYDLEKDTHQEIKVFERNEGISWIYISPDSQRIVFSITPAYGHSGIQDNIYVLELGTNFLKKLIPKAFPLGWFPDSTHILVQTNTMPDGKRINYANGVMAKVNVQTGDFQILKQTRYLASDARLSRDGRYVYYSRQTPQKGRAIFALDLETDKEYQITKSIFVNSIIGYSRDMQPSWHQGD